MIIRILSERDVHNLLSMDECIVEMEETLKRLSSGAAVNPLRSMLRFPDGSGLLGMMPAYMKSDYGTGIKVVTVMPGNQGTPFDSHQGAVMLFELQHGCPLAIVEASSITAIRTAAVSAVATKLLCRPDANKLALLGSGVQAKSHLEAMLQIRKFSQVSVWSRDEDHARQFARHQSESMGPPIKAASSAREAVESADIICTTTSSGEPILKGAWIAPGTHINAVGSCAPAQRELDSAAVASARLFVDLRESTVNESGDFIIPKGEGLIDDSHIIGELGELLVGTITGRKSDSDVTLFKSLGVGVEDLAAAHRVYQKAVSAGVGAEVEFGGPER